MLDHYSAPQDSLKRRAAEYLIGNMAGKYTATSPALEAYEELLPEIARVPADDRFLYLFYKGERNFER